MSVLTPQTYNLTYADVITVAKLKLAGMLSSGGFDPLNTQFDKAFADAIHEIARTELHPAPTAPVVVELSDLHCASIALSIIVLAGHPVVDSVDARALAQKLKAQLHQ